jgi:rubrerythrin
MRSKCPVCQQRTDIPISPFTSKRCTNCQSLLKRGNAFEARIPFLYALFEILPFLREITVVERSPFCCPSCGYNLTGNESGICPECGTPARDKKADPTT